jgi:hypothetical protein
VKTGGARRTWSTSEEEVIVWWSVVLTVLALLTSWLIGNKQTLGWALAFASQGLWLTYAIVTVQWGFVASALAFAVMNWRNWRKWRREDRVARARVEEVSGGVR